MAWIKNESVPSVRWREVEPLAIFRKLYRPLGALAVTFADLEAQLTQTLNLLLGTSRRQGMALEWFMQNVSLRIELFYFLAQQPIERSPSERLTEAQMRRAAAHKGLRDAAGPIYHSLKQANDDRNNLMHGAWTGLSPVDGSFSKDRFRAGQGKLSEIPIRGVTIALLKEEVDYIISVNVRLRDWAARFRRWHNPELWPPSLPEKYLLRSPIGSLLRAHRRQSRQPPRGASRP